MQNPIPKMGLVQGQRCERCIARFERWREDQRRKRRRGPRWCMIPGLVCLWWSTMPLRPLKATCIRAMISGVCTEDPKCFHMCLNNMTWVQSSGPPISPRLPRKTRVERSGKEDALLKRQAQKAEAQPLCLGGRRTQGIPGKGARCRRAACSQGRQKGRKEEEARGEEEKEGQDSRKARYQRQILSQTFQPPAGQVLSCNGGQTLPT